MITGVNNSVGLADSDLLACIIIRPVSFCLSDSADFMGSDVLWVWELIPFAQSTSVGTAWGTLGSPDSFSGCPCADYSTSRISSFLEFRVGLADSMILLALSRRSIQVLSDRDVNQIL